MQKCYKTSNINFLTSVYWLALTSLDNARNILKFVSHNAFSPFCINHKTDCRNISYALVSPALAV